MASLRCGSVTFIQRAGSALNLNVHFHLLALDGVYAHHGWDNLWFFTHCQHRTMPKSKRSFSGLENASKKHLQPMVMEVGPRK